MRITEIQSLHADGGWRPFSYLKMSTDEGQVGWAEYSTNFGSFGLSDTIDRLGARLIGSDPRQITGKVAELLAATRQSSGGNAFQAIASLQNCMFDIKAKALEVPVASLFGGIIRDRIELHWSACGANRTAYSDLLGVSPIRTIADVAACARDGAARHFKALKSKILVSHGGALQQYIPCFGSGGRPTALNAEPWLVREITKLMEALRDGAGRKVELMLDVDCNFRTDGLITLARALEPLDLSWIEVDSIDPQALALLRNATSVPIASGETLYGRDQFRPFFEVGSLDVAVVNVPSNGYAEALRIAQMAETYEINVVAHHHLGNLALAMSAQLCAAIPNLRALDTDVDSVNWQHELVSAPEIQDGHLILADAPGWGVEVNEDAIRARPARTDYETRFDSWRDRIDA